MVRILLAAAALTSLRSGNGSDFLRLTFAFTWRSTPAVGRDRRRT